MKVKSVRIRHGLLGNPHNKNIEKAITKWTKKGYRLKHQELGGQGCLSAGYTLLTFVQEDQA